MVIADSVFTAPAVIVQFATGLWLTHMLHMPLSVFWVKENLKQPRSAEDIQRAILVGDAAPLEKGQHRQKTVVSFHPLFSCALPSCLHWGSAPPTEKKGCKHNCVGIHFLRRDPPKNGVNKKVEKRSCKVKTTLIDYLNWKLRGTS